MKPAKHAGARLFAPLCASLCVSLAACHPAAQTPPAPALLPPLPSPDKPPPSPEFVVTESSDTWVRKTFLVQPRPARVLVVSKSADPRALRVPVLSFDSAPPTTAEELPVAYGFSTLQAAADAARGGDLIAVLPGVYEGFWIGDKPDAGDGRYIHFKAVGEPGSVIIDSPARRDGDRWMILLQAAHHVILEGFNLKGHDTPGDPAAKGPWAGIMIDGDFGASGKLAHHIAVMGNYSHHHQHWGLHATDSHSVLIQDNLFALSAREHGAYVSDGSDNYVIRRNVFFGSHACGLQCNLDPEASLNEVLKHPALRDHPKEPRDRAWAKRLLALADQRFGEHNYPDGRGVNLIIEDNVINQNGKRGGGGINLAGLQRSLIQNNLLYDNYAHGIAAWDNANPFDAEAPGEAMWGCRDNVFRRNTVLMDNRARAALQCHHGSTGCRVYGNILLNDSGPSLQVDASSVRGFDARDNILTSWTDDGMPPALRPLAARLPDAGENQLGVSRAAAAAEMARAGDEPWVLITASWWALNPKRPDFRPRAGAKRLTTRGVQTR